MALAKPTYVALIEPVDADDLPVELQTAHTFDLVDDFAFIGPVVYFKPFMGNQVCKGRPPATSSNHCNITHGSILSIRLLSAYSV